MARYIPALRAIKQLNNGPLTLTQLQSHVGGFIRFIELNSGDLMVVNEASFDQIGHYNPNASSLAGSAGPVFGDAVLCHPSEIE